MSLTKIAFAGFRHVHITSMYEAVKNRKDTEIVAACEQDGSTRKQLTEGDVIDITHENFEKMLAEVDCDVVAVGDYYGARGGLLIEALRAGKHVIADKPICTSLEELDAISELAEANNLSVFSQLDMRGQGVFKKMRTLIREGCIGEIHTINFLAQHPLMLGTRPGWYFEEGNHGGTINDIAIHAVDIIPWLTGVEISEVVAARAWNARTPEYPHFQDGGQLMLKLENNGGAMGDVSYLAPEKCGYAVPNYWRLTVHGGEGQIESYWTSKDVLLAGKDDTEPRMLPGEEDTPTSYLADMLAEIAGAPAEDGLTTQSVLKVARQTLLAQQAADQNKTNVPC